MEENSASIAIISIRNPKLARALVAAQKGARAVDTDARNKHYGYEYASAESMIQEGRQSLGDADLALSQGRVKIRPLDKPLKTGNEEARVVLEIEYVLRHKDGEEERWERDWPCVESNGRPIDKAMGAALTSSLKYMIRDLLQLPRDDEQADMDKRDGRRVRVEDDEDREREREREREDRRSGATKSEHRDDPPPSERGGHAPPNDNGSDKSDAFRLPACPRGVDEKLWIRYCGFIHDSNTPHLLATYMAEAKKEFGEDSVGYRELRHVGGDRLKELKRSGRGDDDGDRRRDDRDRSDSR